MDNRVQRAIALNKGIHKIVFKDKVVSLKVLLSDSEKKPHVNKNWKI